MNPKRLAFLVLGVAVAVFALVRLLGPDATHAEDTHAAAPAETAAPVNVVRITTREYAFEAPDTIPAGVTTLRLLNQGQEFHHAWLARLEDGKTMADLAAVMQAGGPPPSWLVDVGGPNAPSPAGGEANTTVDLAPGQYVLICHIPSASDKVPHAAKGMVRPLVVVEPRSAATMPPATVTLTLTDYDFRFSDSLTAGRQTIRVRNDAAQPHEVVLARLEPGKTAGDLLAWFEHEQGTPPAVALGGTTGLAYQKEAQFDVDLEPGEYALICFLPDAKDGKPHFVHGMVKQVKVG